MASVGLDEAMCLQLELEGRLDMAFNAERLELVTSGAMAVLMVPTVTCGWRIYRSLPRSLISSRFARVVETLVAMDLRVNVAIGSRLLISAGSGQTPSRFLPALGLPPVKIHWGGCAHSLLEI